MPLSASTSTCPPAAIFFWTENKGLTFKEVPQPIFHDVMAKRSCEYSLRLSTRRTTPP